MGPNRLFRAITAILIAATLSGALYISVRKKIQINQTSLALQYARQIANQAEELSTYAREHGLNDPIAWAVRYLTLGNEPRPIEVATIILNSASKENAENYEYESKNGELTYTKLLRPDTATGIRIKVHLGYVGFMGAPNTVINDVCLVILIFFIFEIFYLLFGLKKSRSDERDPAELVDFVLDWTSEAKSTLIQLGMNMKGMTKDAKKLVGQVKEDPTQASGSAEEVFQVARDMNENISKTATTVVSLSRHIQSLRNQVSPEKKKAQNSADSIK
jgi:hypothetical protein